MHAQESNTRDAPTMVQRARGVRERLFERTPALGQASREHPAASLLPAFEASDPFRGYGHLPESFVRICQRLNAGLGADALSDFLQLLLVELAEDFERRFAASGLAEEFRAQFETNLRRMLERAAAPQSWRASLSNDVFLKDLAIARQVLIPCISHLVYRHSGVPRRVVARQRLTRLARAAAYLLRAGGVRPFLENHVHLAMLEHFDPAGRERCLRLVARLLELWPDSKGLIGASWYYDPGLGRISPKLAYLHDVPARQGAIFLRVGSRPEDVAGALVRSETRRRLHQTGDYQPTSYLMVWARADILRHYARGSSPS